MFTEITVLRDQFNREVEALKESLLEDGFNVIERGVVDGFSLFDASKDGVSAAGSCLMDDPTIWSEVISFMSDGSTVVDRKEKLFQAGI